jgi:hypothetical protein
MIRIISIHKAISIADCHECTSFLFTENVYIKKIILRMRVMNKHKSSSFLKLFSLYLFIIYHKIVFLIKNFN